MNKAYDRADDVTAEWERHAVTELYNEYAHAMRERRLQMRPAAIELFDSFQHWGEWSRSTRTIRLSRRLLLEFPWFTVIGILRHEMAHQYVDEHPLYDRTVDRRAHPSDPRIHGDEFQKACRRLGVPLEFSRASADLQQNNLDWRHARADEVTEKMLEKVRKLLALATSGNEHEALLAMNRVREIYAKYNLEQADENRKSEFVHISVRHRGKRREVHEKRILGLLVGHFFVKVIMTQSYDVRVASRVASFEIIGTPQNALMAEYVYHFLMSQSERLVETAELSAGQRFSRVMKKSYRLGILSGFSQKLDLQECQPIATQPGDTGVISRALVTFKRDRAIEDYVGTVFPRLQSSRETRSSIHTSAYSAGQAEGRKITLNKPVTTAATRLGRLLGGK